MDLLFSLLLTFLEMTFVFVGLLLLHSQRKVIGSAPFYLGLGLLFMFAQFVSAAELELSLGGVFSFSIGSTVLLLPYLASLLLLYITDGTLAAQRLIIGSFVMFGLFLYLEEITRFQCSWLGFSIKAGVAASTFDFLLNESRNSMIALAIAHLLDLFMLPVIFTRLKNMGCRLFICLLGALSFTLIADAILFSIIRNWSAENIIVEMAGSLVVQTVAMGWLAILMAIYLRRIDRAADTSERSPLDIFFAFLGGYGSSKILEASLREWEGRYYQVLSNASEMILLLTPKGKIWDANEAAKTIFNVKNTRELKGMKLTKRMHKLDGTEITLGDPKQVSFGFVDHFVAVVNGENSEEEFTLDCSLTLQFFDKNPVWVIFGRDISAERKLAMDKEILSKQLEHAQRIEALGQLAGGIAHDFNNHVHGILGHVDIINLMYKPERKEAVHHLNKIADIAEQSGKLTSQLLGFARKGNYQIVDIDLNELVADSLELVRPQNWGSISRTFNYCSHPLLMRGDRIQLQQVVLNLTLNAVDALKNKSNASLDINVGELKDLTILLTPPAEYKVGLTVEDYIYFSVADNGPGMNEETLNKIFDPFFTTKPVGEGTGMGLSMVYGTITSHKGWIQTVSAVGAGTVFYIILPKLQPQIL